MQVYCLETFGPSSASNKWETGTVREMVTVGTRVLAASCGPGLLPLSCFAEGNHCDNVRQAVLVGCPKPAGLQP